MQKKEYPFPDRQEHLKIMEGMIAALKKAWQEKYAE
jgi:hypothetical protein